MVHLTINGLEVAVEEGTSVLEAARFMGIPIPTLCHMEGLSSYGACRLCVVEIGRGPRSKLVASCTYSVQEGLVVRSASARVLRARRMIIELLLATCPQSRTIQDLAAALGVTRQRFSQERESCVLCGLCVRICGEQMMAGAIGFQGRGSNRTLGTPFDVKSETCRLCGACLYVCPACQLRCTLSDPETPICGACQNLAPPCVEKESQDDMMCYMSPCVACEIDPPSASEIKE